MSENTKRLSLDEIQGWDVYKRVDIPKRVRVLINETLSLSATSGHIALCDKYNELKRTMKDDRAFLAGFMNRAKNPATFNKFYDVIYDTKQAVECGEIDLKVYRKAVELSYLMHNIEPPKKSKSTEENGD